MSTQQKLAIFDIDGTIAEKGVVAESVIAGIRHLRELGFLTTVSTGRGYLRAKAVLGENFDSVVSPGSLMIVEHGTKITDRNGVVLKADNFSTSELGHVIDFIEANVGVIKLVRWNSPDPEKKQQIWCADEKDVAGETEKRSHYADVFTCSFKELRERAGKENVSNVTAQLKSYIVVENLKLHLSHSDVDIIFQDGLMEFIRNISDKAKAIAFLEEHFDTSVASILLAGNAINDVDMLNLSAHTRLLVGEGDTSDKVLNYITCAEEIVRIASPAALGVWLQEFKP